MTGGGRQGRTAAAPRRVLRATHASVKRLMEALGSHGTAFEVEVGIGIAVGVGLDPDSDGDADSEEDEDSDRRTP